MNIWLVHPYAGGPELGRHWRPYWLSEAWNAMGHRAIVVCANFHHLILNQQRLLGAKRIGSVDFWFVDTPHYSGNGIGRLANNLLFGPRFLKDAPQIAANFGAPDLVIASSPHLFQVPWVRRGALKMDARFWLEVRDLWPESIIALGLASPSNPLVRTMGRLEGYAYKHAERVVSLLAGAEPHMRKRGLGEGRFIWIPNGVSDEEIQSAITPRSIDHALVRRLRELKAQGRQVVVYAGAMGPPNAIENMVDAARLLADRGSKAHFVLVGDGVSRAELQNRAMGLSNFEFHPEVDRPIVHAALAEADCAVVVFHRSALYAHGVSPNKLFDYCLCAPRSVIACDEIALGVLRDLVTARCDPESPAALAEALSSSLLQPPRPQSERIERLVKFSYSALARRYLTGIDGRPQLVYK